MNKIIKSLRKNCWAKVIFRNESYPNLCHISGLTIYDEALIHGRWIGRYWAANGFIEPEDNLKWLAANSHNPDQTIGIDLHAFGLEIDGQSLHFGWTLENKNLKPAKEDKMYHSVVTLKNNIRPIIVNIHTEIDGTGFFTRWLEIKNSGKIPAALNAIWPWSGLLARVNNWLELMGKDKSVFTVGYMGERTWGNEGAFIWQSLPNTPLRLESRMGKSGHGTPFFIIRNEATGEHIAGGLEWSGNWAIELTCEQNGQPDALLGFRCGPVNPSPLRVLAPNETITSPKMHLGVLFKDLDGAIQAWHAYLRKNVLCPQPKGRGTLVVHNAWSYHQHEITETRLKFNIDIAADIGAEVFMIDAGWFGNKDTNWWKTIGDWECGNRLPNGLDPIFAYARKKGLLCGLWMEAERIGSESKIIKEHPDWVLKRYGKNIDAGNLDLTKPEVQKWLESQIINLVERYKLDYFKLDYNTSPYEGGQTPRYGYMENSQWRHYEFVYSLYDRLRQRFPDLIMENCAAGGGRNDLGMVKRFHHTCASDWQKAPRSVRILNGMTLALPPERLGYYPGVGLGGHTRSDLDSQLRRAIMGHCQITGFYPDKKSYNPEQVERVKHHLKIYKIFIRPFLAGCRVYHHTPVLLGSEPQGVCALEYVAEDFSQAVIAVFRLAGPADPIYRLYPRGIDRNKSYKITFDNENIIVKKKGEELRTEGLSISIVHPLSSELLLLKAE